MFIRFLVDLSPQQHSPALYCSFLAAVFCTKRCLRVLLAGGGARCSIANNSPQTAERKPEARMARQKKSGGVNSKGINPLVIKLSNRIISVPPRSFLW